MRWGLAALMMMLVAMPTGCGGTPSEEEMGQRSLRDIDDEAQKLSVEGLERQAAAYRDAIQKQEAEMEQLRQERNRLTYDERSGEKARELDQKMQDLAESLKRLTDRHRVYIEKLRQKGVPTDEYAI